MKIEVIGSGSSGNCYRISDGNTALLLDAGLSLPVIQQACHFELTRLSGCLLTHSHGDHAKSAATLARLGVDVFCSPETAREAKLLGHRVHAIDAAGDAMIRAGTFRVRPFDLHHDVRCYGYFIHSNTTGENLVYITDTSYTDYRFPSLHYALVEANYDPELLAASVLEGKTPRDMLRRVQTTHMSIEQTLELLAVNNENRTLRQIYLLHLSDRHSDAERFKQRAQEICGCEVYVAEA